MRKTTRFAVYSDTESSSKTTSSSLLRNNKTDFDYEEEPDAFHHRSIDPVQLPPVTFAHWDEERQQYVDLLQHRYHKE